MTRLLAVDGNALAHRAYHATPPDRRVGAFVTGGLLRMIASTWSEGPFDGLVIALDDPHHNRRRELFADYKAHREDKDPQLEEALDVLPDHLRAAGLTVAGEPGAEADDLLAVVTGDSAGRGWTCSVLSSDRDLLALVSPAVTLLRPRGSMARLKAYGPSEVVAEYGVRPDQYTDLAALRGDPSDGLDGVDGIGPKTAARLLQDYGSVPGIYEALSSLPPRLEAMLRVGRAAVERNRRLMRPLTDLSFELPTTALRIDPDRLVSGLADLGLDATARALRRALTAPPAPPRPPPPTDEPPPDPGRPELPEEAPRPRPAPAPPELVEQVRLFG